MFMKWKALMVGVTIGAMVMAASAVVAAAPYVASAQAAATATAAETSAPGATNTAPDAAGPQGGDQQPDLPGLQESDLLNSAAASVAGLTVPDIISQTQAGQSLAQIAIAKGKTAADVIAAARAALADGEQKAVAAGTTTQAFADAELAEFDARAPQMVASTDSHGGPGGFGGHGRGGLRGLDGADALIQATVSVTGLTNQEVQTQLQAGQTLAQIAQSKGKTADDVITAARTALTTQLQAAVTAGKFTQAQSDAKLAQFNTSATQLMNDATIGHAGGHGGPGRPNDNDADDAGGTTTPANPAPTTAPSSTTNS